MNSLVGKTLRQLFGGAILTLALCTTGCLSPDAALAGVDAEAQEVLARKQEALLGRTEVLSTDPEPGRAAETLVAPGLAPENAAPIPLALPTVLATAAKNSREFQQAKESLYRAVLAYLRECENFRLKPFWELGGRLQSSNDVRTLTSDSEFGATNLIERGGSYALSVGLDFLRFISSPTSETFSSFLNLSISLPFLRNAEQNIQRENLTQADREVLYALRDFERFKQTYGVQVISAYLRVLSQKRRIQNEDANLRSLISAFDRNTDLYAAGRTQKVQVDQAEQQVLRGKNRVIVARQNLDRSVDNLKDLLGLPVDLDVAYDESDLASLEALMATGVELDERTALRAALRNRFDFRNTVDAVDDAGRRVEISKNQLLPEFNLTLSANPGSKALKPLKYNFNDGTYTAATDIDLGLDRDIESISLKSAVLDLQRSLRDQEAAAEQVKLDVRNAQRQLVRTREAWNIAREAEKLAQQRAEMTSEMLQDGRVTTRDFLESRDALISSQNEAVDALVEYRIAFLEYFRDTGALVVAARGLDHEASEALLRTD